MGLFLCFACFFIFLSTTYAQNEVGPNDDSVEKFILDTRDQSSLEAIKQKINIFKQRNESLKNELDALKKEKAEAAFSLKVEAVTQRSLDQALLDLTIARANYDGAEIAYTEVQHIIGTTTNKIDYIQNELKQITLAAGKTDKVKQRIQGLQGQLNSLRELQKMQQKQLDTISTTVDLCKQMLQIQEEWNYRLENYFQIYQQQIKRKNLLNQEQLLEEEQQQWLNKLAFLNEQLRSKDDNKENLSKSRERFQFEIFEAQEKSNLVHLKILLARIQNQLDAIQELEINTSSVVDLNELLTQTQSLFIEAEDLKKLINRKLDLIESQKKIASQGKQSQLFSWSDSQFIQQLLKELDNRYRQQLQRTTTLMESITSEKSTIKKDLSQALSRRQGLPDFNLQAWINLTQKLAAMPQLAIQTLKAIGVQIDKALDSLKLSQFVSIIIFEMFLLLGWLGICKILDKILVKISTSKQSISNNLVFVIVRLIRKNITILFLFAAITFFCLFSGVPFKSFIPVIYLMVVFFIFKMAIGLAKITLLETAPVTSGHDVHLYRNLVWALTGGGLLTMLTVLAYQLPVDYEVSDFFNRLFMLFLLITAILLLRHWRVVPDLFSLYVDTARPYFMKAVRIVSLLIPLSILSTAIIGLLGYVDLAWAISKYEGQFLIVLCGYIILRGFLNDFMEWLSELFIRKLRNGWLWAQAILRPLVKILQIVLCLFSFYFLLGLYGWDHDSYIVKLVMAILNFHLIVIDQTIITPFGILQFIIAAMILIWLSKWTREFSYRWLFSRTTDLGLRNSFAAFTQYTMVTIGLITTLKLVGIDFTSISYILTALAVGIGFGLRDLAKNYVSGFLLLIERPVRTGDVVSISNYEGEVTNIGMRSMTVKTWDNMTVLVPNSETFERSFTNWTHHDSIVRTVVAIKVSRQDDPFFVQKLLLSVLYEMADVVSDPNPEVLLKSIEDTLIEFEVRYFINLQKSSSRPEVRSRVLFSIWEKFKANNISPPNPQQDINVLSFPQREKEGEKTTLASQEY